MTPRFKGRHLGQYFAIARYRLRRAVRRIYLPLWRKLGQARENGTMSNAPYISWSLAEATAKALLDQNPAVRADILEEAEQILSGWTQVPGFRPRQIELERDDRDAPVDRYAYRLLTRLDFLRPLCRATLLCPEEAKYLYEISRVILEWISHRRQHTDWDTVDEAIRILNLLETLALLQPQLTDEVQQAALAACVEAAWTIEINRTRTGNHLIYESLALLALGASFKIHPRAKSWRKLGRRLLEKQMKVQVRDEGMNGELCTNYHLITGANFLKASVVANHSGISFSSAYTRKLRAMAEVAAILQVEDGGFLALGDSDRLQGNSREEKEAKAFARWGHRDDSHPAPAQDKFEMEWLLGGIQLRDLPKATTQKPDGVSSFGGYYFVRHHDHSMLLFDAGPFGLPGASHHGHADSLAFEVHVSGRRFLVDPGGFSYVDHTARAFARSTAAHNTIRVNGENSSEITGSFAFGKSARARLSDLQNFEEATLLVAEHDGYAPLVHRRGILFLKSSPLGLVIFDRLEGRGAHQIEAFFHAEAGWTATQEDLNHLIWNNQNICLHQFIHCSAPVNLEIITGQKEPEWQGWVSSEFGRYLDAPTLTVTSRNALPLDLVSVFSPTPSNPFAQKTQSEAEISLPDLNVTSWRWVGPKLHLKIERV